MLLFIGYDSISRRYCICVSIHLMLLFIRFQRWFTCPGIVSIHLMLLFICRTRRTWNISRSVSIHLILLFIEETGSAEKKLQPFQYISCYSLSEMSDGTQGNGLVSIHLMLLFIYKLSDMLLSNCSFNTSHVTLYQNSGLTPWSQSAVSIHLMLLFI